MSVAQDIRPRPAVPGWLWSAALAATIWVWWLVYRQLVPVSEWLVSLFPVDRYSGAGEALAFFFYDVPKVTMLLALVVFAMGVLRIGRVVSTGHDIELAETGDATLLVPLLGRLEIDHGRRTWDAEPGRTLVFSPSARRTRVAASGGASFEGHVVMLPAPRLAALREGASGGEGRPPADAARIDGAASWRVDAYARDYA